MRLALLTALVCAIMPAVAAAQFPGPSTLQLSAGADGASRNPVMSQDKRWGRLAAFESDATNLVPGAGGGTNVYVVERAPGYGENGTPWERGRTTLASAGLGGRPADAPSTRPSLSGTSRIAPRCVGFVSEASNLVRDDTNGTADAFVHFLDTGRTRRVSLASRGRQSRGTVSEVAVNGTCTRVAFVSDGGDLALTRTRNPSWRSAVTGSTPAGRRQVYVRAIGGTTGIDRALRGLTFLASATDAGTPADGESYDVAFSTNSRAVAFTSAATNLSAGDPDAAPDVYHRTMVREYGARVGWRRPQFLRMDTRLLSSGRGASYSPAVNVDGTVAGYATTDPAFASNGHAQIVRQSVATGQRELASRDARGGPGNGPSAAPALTAGGTWVIFESLATDVGVFSNRRPDTNLVQDIQMLTADTGERWVLDERNATAPATNPATSPHGNYVVFQRGEQVWLNYTGPK
jgi:hypothetical protein